jgi:hypothetical protein
LEGAKQLLRDLLKKLKMKIGVQGRVIADHRFKKIVMTQKIASAGLSALEAEVTPETATALKI